MALLIKNARVFAPNDLGRQNVLMVGEQIAAIGPDLTCDLPDLETIDASGRILTPGFFDQHIHVTGGGGEGGPATRTPELVLSELIKSGTTSVVGVSGTDFTTRSIPNLLAKVRALKTEGVSAWMYTSNYRYPATTLTDSVANDLFFVPEVLGVKIALGDHRSSFPTTQQVLALLADIRVGGMIAGKTGFLHIHLGNIPGAFAMFDEIVARGFPIRHIRPTHCGRIRHVFDAAVEFALKGGHIDITTGASCCFDNASLAVLAALEAGVDPKLITLSTDGHGSVPRFNEKGEMAGLGVGGVEGNLLAFKRLVGDYGMAIEKALPFVTSNVASALGLADQGVVAKGACGNACLFTEDFTLTDVVARGRVMMRDGEVVVKGTFEE
ncbi:beta-aspartyl-peptidase [Sutterella megalosphaeroides]|uniref:Isoaspartyl dipeptidase n=1 Tax=Sutterella megalosphaeroides TaxID=2494234 RepID=A0A2Z6IDP5_9BURK|nr:beta-aspartyl-peptidase [Sutterella megalosphaeroides]BBF23717.1 isoaspartyl dipeptidase [Sutterella megalosphaeroides]